MNKNIFIIGLAVCLAIAIGRLYWLEQDIEQRADFSANSPSRSADGSAERIKQLEENLAEISGQMTNLYDLVKNNRMIVEDGDSGNQSSINEPPSVAPEIVLDPLSPEGIAKADRQQNDYVSQMDSIFQEQEYTEEWAVSIETDMLDRLSDLNTFASQFDTGRRIADGSSDYSQPDIAVSDFSCRSQLCATEIVSGTLDEMLAYQNFMVEQTKSDLPSIVFGTIEPYGSKFKMRAILATDDYEFPLPRESE